ncbi:LysE family transporter [Salibacterium aidingense]|uniref:LysE family transporter n=1 Tax=Salibacterium aidingense TaxID=384933 RepID=UPI003BCDBB7B
MWSTMMNGIVLGFVASPTCPSNGEEIKQGTRRGFLFALAVGLGAVVGDAIILIAVLLGFMPLIEAYPVLHSILWLMGGLVLLYVSWGIFTEIRHVEGVSAMASTTETEKSYFWKAFGIGTAITTFNPFTIVWWIGLLSPMLAGSNNITLFSAAVLAGSLAWFVLLALLLHAGRSFLNKKMRQLIIGTSGCVVFGYSLYFLWQFIVNLI